MKQLFVVLLLISSFGCSKEPPNLSPEAKTAFHATRVINALDVVRDFVIASNETTPPLIVTRDARAVVLWHKTTVQTISVSPNGWRPVVKTSIYLMTCNPQAYVEGPNIPVPSACQPQISPDAVARIEPYMNLALTVIAEVF